MQLQELPELVTHHSQCESVVVLSVKWGRQTLSPVTDILIISLLITWLPQNENEMHIISFLLLFPWTWEGGKDAVPVNDTSILLLILPVLHTNRDAHVLTSRWRTRGCRYCPTSTLWIQRGGKRSLDMHFYELYRWCPAVWSTSRTDVATKGQSFRVY